MDSQSGSGSWWWTGKPGVLQSMESQRVRHDWTTELNWTKNNDGLPCTNLWLQKWREGRTNKFHSWQVRRFRSEGEQVVVAQTGKHSGGIKRKHKVSGAATWLDNGAVYHEQQEWGRSECGEKAKELCSKHIWKSPGGQWVSLIYKPVSQESH